MVHVSEWRRGQRHLVGEPVRLARAALRSCYQAEGREFDSRLPLRQATLSGDSDASLHCLSYRQLACTPPSLEAPVACAAIDRSGSTRFEGYSCHPSTVGAGGNSGDETIIEQYPLFPELGRAQNEPESKSGTTEIWPSYLLFTENTPANSPSSHLPAPPYLSSDRLGPGLVGSAPSNRGVMQFGRLGAR